MNDKHAAQIGVCLYMLDQIFTKIQQRTGNDKMPAASANATQALVEILDKQTSNKRSSLARRIKRGAIDLNENLKDRGIEAVFIGLVRYCTEAKENGNLKLTDGTHAMFVFQQLGENINALGTALNAAESEIIEVKEIIHKFLVDC